MAPVINLRVGADRSDTVDDWGRDRCLVADVSRLAKVRWDVSVGGSQYLPRRKGALIVVNARRFALAPIYAALALGETLHRPVRFVGRPDTAPVGAFSRRIGGLLDHPDEVGGALAADQLVVMGAEHGTIGRVDHTLVGAALSVGASVYPAATSSSPFGRAARLEIGPASKSARKRRGPLSELELADQVRVDIARLLDELGELNTGTPLDWLPLSGLGGA